MKLCRSFTTLSTIAIHAGQSQIIISVLKSGSLVHLQLVQVQPGLCEIGSDQEENHMLIQEQQQLLEKLEKHEPEVLSVVEKKDAELRRREGRKMKQEEEEELSEAMEASLREGWSLLLLLLKRRLEVLKLASDFYHRALEFSASIDRFEDLQIEDSRPTEGRSAYDSVKRGVLGKSLQVLSSSSVLLQKLRQLQKTEALQRRGGVLQEEEEEEEEHSRGSWSSRGPALMLEELVEKLQDRRRKVDQTVRLKLQQAENIVTVLKTESMRSGSDIRSLPDGNILDQNLQFGSTSADLKSKTRTTRPGSRSDQTGDVGPQRRSDDSMKLKSRLISDLQTQFWAEPKSPTRSEEPGKSGSGSDQQPEDPVRARPEETELRADEEINSGLNLNSESRSEDLKPGSGSDETRSGLFGSVEPQHGSSSEGTRTFSPGSRSDLKTRSEPIRDLTSGSQQEPEETKDSQTVFSSVLENRSSSEVKPGDPRPGSGSDETEKRQHGWRLVKIRDLQAGFRSAMKPRPGSEETQVQKSGTGSEIQSLPDGNILDQNLQFGSTSADLQSKTRTTRPGSRSDQTGDVGPQRRSDDSMKLKSRFISDLQTQFWAEPNSPTRSEEPGKSGSGSDQQPEDPVRAGPEETELRADEEINSGLNLNSEDLKPGSGSDETRSGLLGSVEPQHGSRSEGTRIFSLGSRSDLKTRSEQIRDLTSGSQQEPEETKDSQTVFSSVLENRSSSEVKPGDPRPGSGLDETEKRQHGWRLVKIRDLQAGFRSALKPRPGSEQNQVQMSGTGSEIRSLPDGNIVDQNLQFGSTSADLQSKTRTTRPGSRSDQTGDVGPQRRSDDSTKLKSRLISDLQTQFWAEPKSPTRSEEPGKSGSGSDQQPEDPVRAGPEETELRADEEINSGLNLNSESRSEDLKPGSGSDETRSGLLGSVEPQHGSSSEGTRTFSLGSRSDLKTRSEQIRDLTSGSQQEPEETKDSQTVFSSVLENRSSSEVKLGDPRPGSGSDETEKRQHGWRLVKIRDLQAGFRSALKPRPGSEQNQVQMSGTGSEIRSLPDGNILDQNLQFGSTSADLQSKTRTTRPGSRSDQTGDVGPQRRSEDSMKLKSRLISDLQTQFWAEPKSPTLSEEPGKSGSGSDQQPEDPVRAGPEETELRADEEINSGLNLNSESRSEDLKPGSGSDETRSGLLGSVEPQHGSRSEETRTFSLGSRSDLKTRSEQIRDLTSGSQQEPEETKDSQTVFSSVLENRSSSEVKLGDPRPGSGSDETEKRQHGWRLVKIRDLQAGFRSALKPRPGSEETQVQMSGTGSEIRSLPDGNIVDQNLQFGSTSADLQSKTRTTRPGSRSDQTGDVGPQRRSDDSMKLKSRLISDLQTQFWAEPNSPTRSEEPGKSGSGSDQQPEDPVRAGPEETELRADEEINSGLNLNSESRSEDLKPGSGSDETRSGLLGSVEPQHRSRSEETRTFSPGSRSDLKTRSEPIRDLTSGSRQEPEETKDSQTVFSSVLENRSSSEVKPGDPRPGSGSDETEKRQHGWRLVKIRDLQAGFRSALKPRPGSEQNQVQKSGTGSEIRSLPDGNIVDQNLLFGSTSADLQSKTRTTRPGSRSDQTGDVGPQRRSDDSTKLKSRLISDLQTQFWAEPKSPTRSEEPGKSRSGSDQQPEDPVRAGPEETELRADEEINSGLNLNSEDLKPGSGSDETRSGLLGSVEPQHGSSSEGTRTFSPGSRSDLKTRSEQIRDLTSGSQQEPEETKDSQTVFSSVLENRSSSEVKPGDPRPGSGSDETEKRQHGWRLVTIRDLQAGFRSALKPRPGSEETQVQMSGTGSEVKDGSSQVSSNQDGPICEKPNRDGTDQNPAAGTGDNGQTTDQQSMLGNEIPDGEDHAHRSLPAIQRQQLLMAFEYLEKKVNVWMQQSSSVLASSSEGVRQLSEAEHTLNTHLELQTQAQSAGRDVQNLKQILDQLGPTSRTSRTGPSTLKALTEQLRGGTTGSGSPPAGPAELSGRLDLVLKEQQSLETRISSNLQTLQPFVIFLRTAQQGEEEMADLREMSRRRDGEEEAAGKTRVETYRQKVLHAEELGNGCIQAATMVLGSALNLELVQETVRQTMQRLSETKEEVDELRAHHQNQNQNQMFWRRHQERLMKTHQDLNCVSELLDSCTLMDLGSDLQTSRLLDHFRQASPHFRQLDDEVENVVKTWEGLRGVPDHLEEAEEELAELLELQKTVTEKIQQSESILDLSSSFHLTAKQLEVLLQSEPSSSSAGSAEARQQIQNLLKTASTLKSDVCAAVTQSRQTGFQVERLEARFDSLDSRCRSWLNEAARCEEKQRREQVTRLLLGDINQLRDSFKDVKKRFSNTKFNYLKRNDRTRNVKAVRNQLQQVELYEEKLQALRKRVHGVAARLGSEVRDGGVVRQVEDAINELQRQMGELERSVREHQKTLDMTCRLQQAMEEYQFWCEEASATIARVGKFSTECRSTEAASVLYRQFEKFVWPTVPQQEERISQIAELAVRLHGAEEGRRYIEKTVSKHSEMVASIRELSDGLMELEAKLKSESLRRQNDEEEEDRSEQRTEKETEEKENKMKEKKKVKKKKQKDDRSTQEAADMCELKETGHTPELTAEHDGKEVRSGREVLSEISISTEANRQVNVVHSQSQPVVTESRATKPPSAIGPSFSDIQKEFQKKELKETLHQTISTCCASTAGPSQDASAEEELQQQEVAMEDSLSNDEYDCVSPDDMSLPPLAETPESNMFQSDVEESFCFSSHSVHISQYSQQCLAQSEPAGTGAVPQQEESIQREGCPTSSISLHNRLRTGSSGLVQSPMTVPSPRLFTSTLCTILKTRTTSTDNYKKSADLSLDSPEPTHRCGSNLVHDNKSTNGLFKDDYVPERKSPSPSTKEINDNVPSLNSDLSPACCPEPPREKCGPCDPQCQAVAWENTSLTKSIHGSDSRLHQDMNPKQRSTETTPQREGLSRASTSLGTQQNIYLQSSESHCVASQDSNISAEETPSSLGRTKPQVDPVLTTKSFTATPNIPDPVGHKHVTHPWDADLLQPCTTTAQTITKPSEEIKMSQSTTGLRSVLNQIVPSSETSKDAAATQRPVHCNSQHEGSFNQGTFDPPDGQTNVPPHTNTISNIRFHKQSSQTVHSLHGSLPSAHVQQCVHGPGMSPSSPTQPRPEAQTQALSQQANLHVTPPPSPPHLLTPTQDPDICHPMVIREEIRLTPQIQGPPLPPPHPPHLAQAESLPQGKASRSGPPCFTRPLSQATVMEGSPVTLEVEVMGHPEPKLTWLKDGEVSARLAPPCDQGKHFLFLPESDGGLKEARAAGGQDSQRTAGTSSGGGGWLVAEVLDIISVDWYTWFGTLCVLLWLIYLIIL